MNVNLSFVYIKSTFVALFGETKKGEFRSVDRNSFCFY
jgi:hypothetical protein